MVSPRSRVGRHLRVDAERIHLAERDRRGQDGSSRLPERPGPAAAGLAPIRWRGHT
jgi:hypothetical protein